MPTYDYRCSTTGAVYKARHAMSMEIQTWAELCACIGLEPGSMPADGPVERLANGGAVVQSRSLKNPELAPCGRSSGCGYGSNGGGGCGF